MCLLYIKKKQKASKNNQKCVRILGNLYNISPDIKKDPREGVFLFLAEV
tara:strand:+ start:578 stop:724 length:147 start_codon:yes stop_codon:yes gene_type:complete